MLEGKAVLIIDDDAMLLNMYGEQLKYEGMLVEYAHDGAEAISMANQNIPNIIILDIMMPKLNGFEVLRSLKSEENTKNIPVIVLSALSDPDKKKKALDAGAHSFMVKSDILPIDMVQEITKLLSQDS